MLTDEHKGTVRHPASVDGALGDGDLGEVPAEVHGARLVRVAIGPGHTTLDREVDLEGARPVPKATEALGNPGR